MLGIILGLLVAGSSIGGAVSGSWESLGFVGIVINGVAMAVLATLLGLLFTKTMGIALMFGMLGAVITAVIEFINGQAGTGSGFLVQAFAFWASSQLLGRVQYGRQRAVANGALPARALENEPLSREDRFEYMREVFSPQPRVEKTPEERAVREAQRVAHFRERAANGDLHAESTLWADDGAPVRDPADLVEGRIYSLGYDLGVYKGTFYGRRFEGFGSIDDGDEITTWFKFEPAETGQKYIGGASWRVSREDLVSGGRPRVVEVPVSQEHARDAFDHRRRLHATWERDHPQHT